MSWSRTGVGLSVLLFAAGARFYGERQLARSMQLLAASPSGLVADLMPQHERELEGWTGRKWLVSLGVAVAAGALVVVERMVEAVRRDESLAVPVAVAVAYVLALAAVALTGAQRVRVLRRELGALRQVQAELSEGDRAEGLASCYVELVELTARRKRRDAVHPAVRPARRSRGSIPARDACRCARLGDGQGGSA